MNKEQIMQMCEEDPEIERTLQRFVGAEAKNKLNPHWLGLEWNDVPSSPQKLNKLVQIGVLTMPFKSNSSKQYKIANLEQADSALTELSTLRKNNAKSMSLTEAIKPDVTPKEIFDDIVGHEQVKYWLKRLLDTEGCGGCLMIGPPASAKTMFLSAIAEKMGGQYYTGTGATRRGIQRYIVDTRPNILIIDELDKLSDFDQSALLSVLESGVITELKVGRTSRTKMDIKIFAAGNYERNVSPLLKSRFRPYIFHFKPYSKQEYIDIVKTIGPKRFDHTPEFCEKVAEAMWQLTGGDPRSAMNTLKACKTEDDLANLVDTMEKYSQ